MNNGYYQQPNPANSYGYQQPPQPPSNPNQRTYTSSMYGTLREDYSVTGILTIDIAYLEQLIARAKSGDTGVLDVYRGALTGKIKLSYKLRYVPKEGRTSTHMGNVYVVSDLPPRDGYASPQPQYNGYAPPATPNYGYAAPPTPNVPNYGYAPPPDQNVQLPY